MANRDNGTPSEDKAASAASPTLRRLWPLVAVVAAMAAIFIFDLDRFLSFQALKENREFLVQWTNENRVLAALIFVSGYCVMVALSVPGAVWATLAGGFVFGTVVGGIYVVVGATLGATAIFLIARYALADMLRAKAGNAVRKMEAGFNENALSYMFVLRLVPLFPFWLVNLVPAFLGVPLSTYVVGTFFGIIPGSIVYVSVGNGLGAVFEQGGVPDLGIAFTPEVMLPILGLAALSLIPVFYKRFKGGKVAAAKED
ncbi:MAG: TVP38/TMEM64 family protein [Rhodospirillales bacterium]|nr:TVP38/TMEM64 family protein [Rhodospirillales bacterium]